MTTLSDIFLVLLFWIVIFIVAQILSTISTFFTPLRVDDGLNYGTTGKTEQNTGWEDCHAAADSWDGKPGKHRWGESSHNVFEQHYCVCRACKKIKATRPTALLTIYPNKFKYLTD